MFTKSPIIASVAMLWLASLACGQSVEVPTLDPNAASTAIVETINAIQSQETQPVVPSAEATRTPVPSVTSLPSLTPPFSPTPNKPTITVSVDTFCRTGPGKDYDKVGILLVDESTEIVGRHATGQFWYVRNPDVGPEFCWISGEYATISGNTLVLLVVTPAAAPATDFEAVYRGMGHCSNSWWSDIRLNNLSDGWFQSLSITLMDADTNTSRSISGNGFAFKDGCSPPTTVDMLTNSAPVLISSPDFPYSLNAHHISASITLCGNINLSGGCITKKIEYIP